MTSRTSTTRRPAGLGFAGSCRRPAPRHRGDRRSPRLPSTASRSATAPPSSGDPRPRRRRRAASRRRPHRPIRVASQWRAAVRSVWPTAPSPTARPSSTTRSRRWPSSTPICSMPCARPRRMPRTTGSSSSSTVAGAPRRTRNSSSERPSRSTAQEDEAARWVATPATSAHVSGDAVDIGHADAAAWLSKHGAEYGLCQIYRNEPWHYELRPDAAITVARPCTPTLRTIRGCGSASDAHRMPPTSRTASANASGASWGRLWPIAALDRPVRRTGRRTSRHRPPAPDAARRWRRPRA